MKERVMILVILLIFVIPLGIAPGVVQAGPLQTFAKSPIPYWDDDSAGVDFEWIGEDQTVTFSNNSDVDREDWGGDVWTEDHVSIGEWTATSWTFDAPTTDGDIATLEVGYDAGSAWSYWECSDVSVTGDITFQIYYKMNSTSSVNWYFQFNSEDSWGGGSSEYASSRAESGTTPGVWKLYEYDITLTTVEAFRFAIRSYAGCSIAFDCDYIRIGPSNEMEPRMSARVPIDRADTQELEFMSNVSLLDSSVKCEFWDNYTASGFYANVSSSYIYFPDDGMNGYSYAAVPDDGVVRIRFRLDDYHKTYRLYVYDVSYTLINMYVEYMGRAYNNWFNMTGNDFNGTLTMYYMQGDVNYRNVINPPTWTRTGSSDSDVTQGLFESYVDTSNAVDHDLVYSTELPYFGYLRTQFEYYHVVDTGTGANMTWMLKVDFDNSDAYAFFWLKFCPAHGITPAYLRTNVTVADEDGTVVYQETTAHTTGDWYFEEFDSVGKVMLWRSTEDHLGMMNWGNFYDNQSLFNGALNENNQWIGDNETTFVTEDPIEDWDVTLSLHYLIENENSNDVFVDFQYKYFEYDYYQPGGIVQPHFSSTFYEFGRSPYATYVNGDNWINVDAYDNPPPDDAEPGDMAADEPDIFTQIANAIGGGIGAIGNLLGGIGATIGGVIGTALSGLGDAIVTGFVASMGVVALMWGTVLDVISPGLGTSVVGGISSAATAIINSFSLIVTFITYTGAAFNAGLDLVSKIFVLIVHYWPLIALGLFAWPLMAFTQGLKTKNWYPFQRVIGIYFGVALMIAKAFFTIGTTILNVIGNFIPFT